MKMKKIVCLVFVMAMLTLPVLALFAGAEGVNVPDTVDPDYESGGIPSEVLNKQRVNGSDTVDPDYESGEIPPEVLQKQRLNTKENVDPDGIASVLSDGSVWVIVAVAVAAVGTVIACVIVKKKKTKATASSD